MARFTIRYNGSGFMKVDILGIAIDDLDEDAVEGIIEERLSDGRGTFIATPNPEMILLAQKDAEFRNILNSADIKIPDGYGLKIGARILGRKLCSRATGTDLMQRICRLAGTKGLSVYLLGAEEGVARKAEENLKKILPNLKIVGAESGGNLSALPENGISWNNQVILAHINAVKPDILFVALGHRKQEKWIFENFKKLAGVKVAMGVGGAFDFYSGKMRRAPLTMRRLGLEWLWRLFLEPRRYPRILAATILFPLACFTKK